MMAKYQSRLDNRLSQPKLQSPVRRESSLASLHSSIEHDSSPRRATVSAFSKHMKSNINQESAEFIPTANEKRKNHGSMIELYKDVQKQISKPSVSHLRNSANIAMWETNSGAAPSQTVRDA